jgi:hypothetical protein
MFLRNNLAPSTPIFLINSHSSGIGHNVLTAIKQAVCGMPLTKFVMLLFKELMRSFIQLLPGFESIKNMHRFMNHNAKTV